VNSTEGTNVIFVFVSFKVYFRELCYKCPYYVAMLIESVRERKYE